MILPLSISPAEVLRRPVAQLSFPLKKNYRRLIADMEQTVRSARGVGLAATQVGQSLDLALIYLEEAELPCFPIINPKITSVSEETEVMEEGCLSLPGVFGLVKRPKKITITARNLEGEEFTLTDDTFLARVIQHEVDHLRNILIADKFLKITQGAGLLQNYLNT